MYLVKRSKREFVDTVLVKSCEVEVEPFGKSWKVFLAALIP